MSCRQQSTINQIMEALLNRIKLGKCCYKMKRDAKKYLQCGDLTTMFMVCVYSRNYKFMKYVLLHFTRRNLLDLMLDRLCRVCVGNNDAHALQLLIAQAVNHGLWNSSSGQATWQSTMAYALQQFILSPSTYNSKRIDVINALKTVQGHAKFRSDPAYLEEGSPSSLDTLTPHIVIAPETFVFGVGMVSPGDD